jgi:hypothetical protein
MNIKDLSAMIEVSKQTEDTEQCIIKLNTKYSNFMIIHIPDIWKLEPYL